MSSSPPSSAPGPPENFDPVTFSKIVGAVEPRFSGPYSDHSLALAAAQSLRHAVTFAEHQMPPKFLSTRNDRCGFFRSCVVYLGGEARTYMEQVILSANPETIDVFMSIIDRRFLPPDRDLLVIDDLLSLRQGSMTLQSFTSEFDRHSAAIRPEDRPSAATLSRMWLRGLTATPLRAFLTRLNPPKKSVPELLSAALQFQISSPAPSSSSTTPAGLSAMPTTSRAPPRRLVDRDFARRMAQRQGHSVEEADRMFEEFRCFRCGQTGHIARACPNTSPAPPRRGRGRGSPTPPKNA